MTSLENNVMGAVRMVYLARQLSGTTALKLYVCVASLWGIGRLVWVSKVFENLANVGLEKSLQFMLSAILQTDMLVQLLLIVGALAVFSLLLDLFRVSASTRALSV